MAAKNCSLRKCVDCGARYERQVRWRSKIRCGPCDRAAHNARANAYHSRKRAAIGRPTSLVCPKCGATYRVGQRGVIPTKCQRRNSCVRRTCRDCGVWFNRPAGRQAKERCQPCHELSERQKSRRGYCKHREERITAGDIRRIFGGQRPSPKIVEMMRLATRFRILERSSRQAV